MRYASILTAIAMSAMLPLAACSDKPAKGTAADLDAETSLTKTIGSNPELSDFAKALDTAGLAGVFDGPGDYTVLAPDNSAFGKLGDAGKTLLQPDQKAALAAVLREQILPGAIMPEDIEKSLANANGKPVSMVTLGSGEVVFTKQGEKIVVTSADGKKANISGTSQKAKNGVVMSVDSFLKAVDSGE